MDDSAETLSNEPIDVEGLPRLRAEAFVAVEPRYVLGTIVGSIVVAVGVLVGGVVLNNRTDRPAFLAAALAIAVRRKLRRVARGWRWGRLSLQRSHTGIVSWI